MFFHIMKVQHIVRHKLASEIWVHSFNSYYFAVLSDAGLDTENKSCSSPGEQTM